MFTMESFIAIPNLYYCFKRELVVVTSWNLVFFCFTVLIDFSVIQRSNENDLIAHVRLAKQFKTFTMQFEQPFNRLLLWYSCSLTKMAFNASQFYNGLFLRARESTHTPTHINN